jgi:quinol monooxygenase YgiN
MQMIYVIATVELNQGAKEKYLAELKRVTPLVRKEKGCLEYGPAVDVSTGIPFQMPRRENVVTLIERWESVDALKAHLTQPHFLEYRERVKDVMKGVSIQVLTPAT